MLEIIFGILVGFVLTRLFFRPKYTGTLVAYDTHPDEPTDLYLELDESPDVISKHEYVTFKVRHISQK